jgi:hypothetical protein
MVSEFLQYLVKTIKNETGVLEDIAVGKEV